VLETDPNFVLDFRKKEGFTTRYHLVKITLLLFEIPFFGDCMYRKFFEIGCIG